MTEPALERFRTVVMTALRSAGPDEPVSRSMLRDIAKAEVPEICDDNEPCGCEKHAFKWHHTLDRAVYDLRNRHPPKVLSVPKKPGWYQLGS
jgi:hypothetical protein